MRKRNNRIRVWLDDKEYEKFVKLVKRSGISQEAYLWHLINNLVPNDAPPPDYYGMMRELYHIGTNLDQIAQIASITDKIDKEKYQMNIEMLTDAIAKITRAVIAPRLRKEWRPHLSGR